MDRQKNTLKIADIERHIADLKARWPKHSVPPSMLIELDDLEKELRQARQENTQ